MIYLIIGIFIFLILILLLRALGSWMLRIDEVIKELKEIKKVLQSNE